MSVVANQGLGRIRLWHFARSHHQAFGSAVPSFPESLDRPKRTPLDQEDTDFCTAYGEATSNGYEQEKDFSGEWQTQAEGKYLGSPITDGADPYPSMQAVSVYGSLPAGLSPFSLAGKGATFIANWINWPVSLEGTAEGYRTKLIPYYVDGSNDTFDNIRNALYQAYLSNEKGVVKTFGFWFAGFNVAANDPSKHGIMPCPAVNEQPVSRHRWTFVDWKTIQGTPYLVGALTQGEGFGDGGICYFDRLTVNQIFANSSSDGLGLYINRVASDSFSLAFQWFASIYYFIQGKVIAKLNGRA